MARPSPLPPALLQRLRRLCLGLPGASETVTFGHPTFRAGGATFAVLEPWRGAPHLVFKCEPLQQQALVEADPRFVVAPYAGRHGWVSLRADGPLDWREVRRLVEGSHRLVSGAAQRPSASRSRSRKPSRQDSASASQPAAR